MYLNLNRFNYPHLFYLLPALSCQEGFGLELRYLVTVHPIINREFVKVILSSQFHPAEGMRQKLIVLDTSLQLMVTL